MLCGNIFASTLYSDLSATRCSFVVHAMHFEQSMGTDLNGLLGPTDWKQQKKSASYSLSQDSRDDRTAWHEVTLLWNHALKEGLFRRGMRQLSGVPVIACRLNPHSTYRYKSVTGSLGYCCHDLNFWIVTEILVPWYGQDPLTPHR